MSCIAVETPVELERRARAVPSQPEISLVGAESEPDRTSIDDVQPWELHSELVLVCPEVCERARELLPERDPDAFLARVRESTLLPAPVDDELQVSTSLPTAFLAYVLWRAVETASCAFVAVGAVVALALLAEALH